MAELNFNSVTGMIRQVTPFNNSCCEQQVQLINANGITNIIVRPSTLVAGGVRLRPGMTVTAFYDADAAAPTIFPPRFDALIIAPRGPREEVFAGYFDNRLVARNNALRLNIGPNTNIVTANGQQFTCSPAGRLLIVYYRTATRSIPPQTTPHRIIVVC